MVIEVLVLQIMTGFAGTGVFLIYIAFASRL
jgi:hypothetical protein